MITAILRREILLFALAVAHPSLCDAAASVAKQPASIRQSYVDGGYTELTCSDTACSFLVSKRGSEKAYKMPRLLFGYRISVDAYDFFEEVGARPFYVSLPVSCTAEDMKIVAEINQDTAECSIHLEAQEDSLKATHIRISGIAETKYVSRLRQLGITKGARAQ